MVQWCVVLRALRLGCEVRRARGVGAGRYPLRRSGMVCELIAMSDDRIDVLISTRASHQPWMASVGDDEMWQLTWTST